MWFQNHGLYRYQRGESSINTLRDCSSTVLFGIPHHPDQKLNTSRATWSCFQRGDTLWISISYGLSFKCKYAVPSHLLRALRIGNIIWYEVNLPYLNKTRTHTTIKKFNRNIKARTASIPGQDVSAALLLVSLSYEFTLRLSTIVLTLSQQRWCLKTFRHYSITALHRSFAQTVLSLF